MKKINLILILLSTMLFSEMTTLVDTLKQRNVNPYHQKNRNQVKPFYQGMILEILNAKPYTYLKLAEIHPDIKKEDNNKFWIVANELKANEGDVIRFQEEMVIKKFKSDVLNKEFHDLVFASGIEYKIK